MRLIVIGAAAIVLVGAFVMLINRGDAVTPAREEASIELPDAFAD